jgi:signal transduction histidine kinase
MLDRERSMGALARLADEKQRLSSAVLSGQDAERRRLSLELHDGPGQTLVGALLHLDLELRNGGERDQLRRARGLVAQALADLRAVSRDLHPPGLQQHGLVQTLRTLAQSFASDEMQVAAEIDAEVPAELPASTALGLFRIAQAALANSVRHARAAQAVLRLHQDQGELVLEVEDNGVGFVPLRTEHGIGVPGMRERAQSLGGRIAIESNVGRGTLIRATSPLART